jgi:predicted O-linked N-acetylglucosamine transferase (SPINDLY family)
MAGAAFDDWLARGRTHQFEGRPADAIPCFRRAAREDPASPVPWFHLGEVYWQLGQSGDALAAWRASAQRHQGFLPPRLALAEAAMASQAFEDAHRLAVEALAVAPDDARARATAGAAAAATGDAEALRGITTMLAADAGFVREPSLAGALAVALPRADDEAAAQLLAVLAPGIAALPAPLLAAAAERTATMPPALAERRWSLADAPALRRLAISVQSRDGVLAAGLVAAYCALMQSLPPPAVPLLWPTRTAGRTLRVAWLVPAVGSTAWNAWRAVAGEVLAAADAPAQDAIVLTAADARATRDALASSAFAPAPVVALPPTADAETARVIAARDCDVLIDAAGLEADTGAMLAARPARALWTFAIAGSAHVTPLVDREFKDARSLARALAEKDAEVALASSSALTSPQLAQHWDAAVEAHRAGDEAGAAASYAQVLAEQPAFAPALHLSGLLARAAGDAAHARSALAGALASAPTFAEARLAAGELALEEQRADDAVALAREGLARAPMNVALWRALGLAELARRDGAAAEDAFRRALLLAPADAQAHFNHGVALQMRGDAAGAARAYQRALTFDPDLVAADFNLGVLFAQQGNRDAAVAAYRHVLGRNPAHVTAYKNLGEVLFASGRIEDWLANFRRFEAHCPDALPLAVQALEACQHQADFAKLDRYLEGLRKERFRARDENELVDCLEELLYLLLFFDIEPEMMLRFAQTYDQVATRVYGAPLPRAMPRRPGPLRVGYLSADLRNHVMGKMMWQAIAHHDAAAFELYFYANQTERDAWSDRFAEVGKRFVPIAGMDDRAAVEVLAADDLDLLVDLSTHTRGARPGILARKPARVQMTHVASAGTVGLATVDFKLTDRYADVPENQAFQVERLLAMEGCVYPFRRVEPAAVHPFERAALHIAADTVVLGAFVTSMKLSRRCLTLWRDVLERLPRACLAFSPAHPAHRESYVRLAGAMGVAAERLLFLPQGRDDAENQARYRLVDLVLDPMPFGGVNGSMEALAMGVPVVTLVGKRHGERTTYSILRNLGVPQTIAETGRDYVDLAVRLATDPRFRADVQAAIALGLASSPLVDMPRHTRNLEAAYRAALAAAAPEVPLGDS